MLDHIRNSDETVLKGCDKVTFRPSIVVGQDSCKLSRSSPSLISRLNKLAVHQFMEDRVVVVVCLFFYICCTKM